MFVDDIQVRASVYIAEDNKIMRLIIWTHHPEAMLHPSQGAVGKECDAAWNIAASLSGFDMDSTYFQRFRREKQPNALDILIRDMIYEQDGESPRTFETLGPPVTLWLAHEGIHGKAAMENLLRDSPGQTPTRVTHRLMTKKAGLASSKLYGNSNSLIRRGKSTSEEVRGLVRRARRVRGLVRRPKTLTLFRNTISSSTILKKRRVGGLVRRPKVLTFRNIISSSTVLKKRRVALRQGTCDVKLILILVTLPKSLYNARRCRADDTKRIDKAPLYDSLPANTLHYTYKCIGRCNGINSTHEVTIARNRDCEPVDPTTPFVLISALRASLNARKEPSSKEPPPELA